MCLPDIFIYNPTCDFAIANGTRSWQPNRLLAGMEADTGNLPQFLCNRGDIVLIRDHPSRQLLENLLKAGFSIPVFRTIEETLSNTGFAERQFGAIRPWGWSPEIHARLSPLKKLCGEKFITSPVSEWKDKHRELNSRQTAREVLSFITRKYPFDCFIPSRFLPVKCQSVEEVELQAAEWGPVMVKMPWSSSGRGLQPVTTQPMNISIKQRLNGMLREQGYIFAEPYLDKTTDLGFLYEADQYGIRLKGLSRFFTDPKGQYRGNYLNGYQEKKPEEEMAVLNLAEKILPEIHMEALRSMEITSCYHGPIGIDTLIFRNYDGKLTIQPCVEINWRYTMGHVSLELEKHIYPASKAIFGTYYNKGKTFQEFSKEKSIEFPLQMREDKIYSGFVALTEFSRNNQFGAYIKATAPC